MHRSRRDLLRVGAAGLAGLATAGCLGDDPSDAATVEMTDDLTFEPGTVSITAGGTVTWENVGEVSHTVTATADSLPAEADYFASGDFDDEATARANMSQGLIDGGDSYEHTYEVAGSYEYVCLPHESAGMVGTVQVE